MPVEIVRVLPYCLVVGQEEAKRALEISYVDSTLGGVLLSGERGTGKSTIVRAFSRMTRKGQLPVTIPINATEDRVVGGYRIDELMRSKAVEQPGLLEEADGSLLYVDEINLLDDHIVNIILDVAATGILHIEREGRQDRRQVDFTLVGTMNPEEGSLRPQLEDRFALMVDVTTGATSERWQILKSALDFDEAVALARNSKNSDLSKWEKADQGILIKLEAAKAKLAGVDYADLLEPVTKLAAAFKTDGSRAERVMVRASRALAAISGKKAAGREELEAVAKLALTHRQKWIGQRGWGEEHQQRMMAALDGELDEELEDAKSA